MKELFQYLVEKDNIELSNSNKLKIGYQLKKSELIIEDEEVEFRNSLLTKLPDGLTFYHDLTFVSCFNLKRLPNNLKINGDLEIERTAVDFLPDDLKLRGFIYTTEEKKEWFKDNFPKFRHKIL